MNVVTLRSLTGVSTHQGQVRDHNEDSWFVSEGRGVWAVADGMGGHENGEWASGVVVEALEKLELSGAFEARCEQIAGALHAANSVIQKESIASNKQMGT